MQFLKVSTAHTFRIGPFLDSTDGNTQETGLTITQPDIRLSKAGGDFAQLNAAGTLTHDEAGWYILPLDATDTGTCGPLIIAIHESGALPVWKEFMVVNANVFDSLFAAATTDYLQVDATQLLGTAWLAPGTAGTPDVNVKLISGDAAAADNCEADYDGTGYVGGTIVKQADVTKILGTATHAATEAGTQCVEVVRWGGNDIAATAVNGVPKVALTHVNAAAQTATLDTIKAETVEILTDTAVIGVLGAGLSDLPWNADWDAEVESECNDAVVAVLAAANTELAAVPSSTGGLRAMVQFIFEKMRHKGQMNKDTGVETLMKDDGSTPLGTATHTTDGVTITRGEMT